VNIVDSRNMNARSAALVEKIEALPDERIAEIELFVDFIRQREEQRVKNWQVTVEAMEAARRGEAKSFDSTDEMMTWLHADEDAGA
jgi:hypothetical protein